MSILWLLLLIGLWLLKPASALAVCPVCTVAVGAGLGLARYFGIDDTVSGVWFGGLILSSSLWLINWLNTKRLSFPYKNLVIVVGFYAITLIPLYFWGMIGHELHILWGVDKLILGIGAGSLAFALGAGADKYLRTKKADGKAHFAWQKVILPVSLLLVTSLAFYLITK
jgi:hypothetical protein